MIRICCLSIRRPSKTIEILSSSTGSCLYRMRVLQLSQQYLGHVEPISETIHTDPGPTSHNPVFSACTVIQQPTAGLPSSTYVRRNFIRTNSKKLIWPGRGSNSALRDLQALVGEIFFVFIREYLCCLYSFNFVFIYPYICKYCFVNIFTSYI